MRDVITRVDEWRPWPCVDAALSFTPVQALIAASVVSEGSTRGRAGFSAQLSKAENFERRRIYYARSLAEAGLGPDGRPL